MPTRAGEGLTDSLAAGAWKVYTLELGADRFVRGVVDQRTVDVRITVRDPNGDVMGRFDGRRTGAEPFHFEGREAGGYRIEIAAAGEGAGRYRVRLERVEPVAADLPGRVDQLMASYSANVPGGVVAVIREGELAFARAYGMANITHDVPFEVGTRTNIGSTTKQFTAFAITLLDSRGELSLDDDVRLHIPELPDLGPVVTLRHLLTHTSGYREFLNTLALGGRRIDRGDYVDRDEIIEIVQRQPALQNEPGAEWNYNNTGYSLLATVVERVTGSPFPKWMRHNVFLPLGMESTVVKADPLEVVENSAAGYVPAQDGGYRNAPDLGGAMGAGGIYTTVGDLARWIVHLEEGALGGPALIETMTTPHVLSTGDTTEYGFGFFLDEFRGLRRIHHGGADVAHRSMLAYYPETRTGIVTLSNNASFSPAVAAQVAAVAMGDALEPEPGRAAVAGGRASSESPAAADMAPDAIFDPDGYDVTAFDEFAGRYSLDPAPTFILRFFREGETLLTQATGQPKIPIRPTSDSSFALVGVAASVTFHRDEGGAVTHATLHQNGEHRATRVEGERWTPSTAELEAYTGRYYSEELQTFYTVAIADEKLVVRHPRFDDVALDPSREDTFGGGFPMATVEFVRDEHGRVTALLASNGRARGIRFARVR